MQCSPDGRPSPSSICTAFYSSTLWHLGNYRAAQEGCAAAYEILSRVDHPYSRLLIDTVQAQIWIEQEELDRAETLMREAVQQCMTHNVPTMLAVCTGRLGSVLARNNKASEAVKLLEKGFADRIYDAAGTYGQNLHAGGPHCRLSQPLEDWTKQSVPDERRSSRPEKNTATARKPFANWPRRCDVPVRRRKPNICSRRPTKRRFAWGCPITRSARRRLLHKQPDDRGTEHESLEHHS